MRLVKNKITRTQSRVNKTKKRYIPHILQIHRYCNYCLPSWFSPQLLKKTKNAAIKQLKQTNREKIKDTSCTPAKNKNIRQREEHAMYDSRCYRDIVVGVVKVISSPNTVCRLPFLKTILCRLPLVKIVVCRMPQIKTA